MTLRVLTLVALLLQFIFHFDIDCQPAYSQTATAMPVNGGGMSAILFNTKNGQLRVNLPDDTSEGDTISGSVIIEPKGRNQTEQTKNEDELNGYVVEIADQKAPCRLGDFKCVMPTANNIVDLVLKDKKGTRVCSTSVKIYDKPPPLPCAKYPGTCMLPPYAQAGWPIQCRGPCDGDFNNSSVKVAGKELVKFCESPRKLVVECPNNVQGTTTIEMREGNAIATGKFTILAVDLKCGLTDIERGKTTTLAVTVWGLDGISEPVDLQINNLAPGVVQLDGGDKQTVKLEKQTGTWTKSMNVSAIRSGSFSFVAWVLEPPIINVTYFQPYGSTRPIEPPPQQASQPATPSIAGTWSSTYGPMTLEVSNQPNGLQQVKGHWQQAADKQGVIEEGVYDPKAGTVNFSYYEHWINVHGTASLNLSADGRTLEGTWTQAGSTGRWTLTR
ncbi:MAG: hypothetical protein K2Y22_11025 [Candidatus Obscuribacterales bacterium]|nr:hypothetical protein [Candidatus Obscuribacterales bacterium]